MAATNHSLQEATFIGIWGENLTNSIVYAIHTAKKPENSLKVFFKLEFGHGHGMPHQVSYFCHLPGALMLFQKLNCDIIALYIQMSILRMPRV